MDRIHDYVRRFAWLLPIASVLILFSVTAIHFVLFATLKEQTDITGTVAVRREVWKLIWIAGSICFCITALASVLHSSYVLTRLRLTRITKTLLLIGAVVWTYLSLSLWFQKESGIGFGMIGGYSTKLLSNLIGSQFGHSAELILVCSSTLGFGAMIFIVASACGLMHPKDADNVDFLAERVRLFFQVMFLSAALAFSAVCMIFGVFHWSAALMEGRAESIKNASLIADTATFGAGLFYSLVMVMAFAPPALALQRMAEVVYVRRKQEDKQLKLDDWKASVGLGEMPLSAMKTYIALGVPLISGLFTALAKSLVN